MKKIIFTLNIDNYAPEICKLTYPYIQKYADKIGAEIYIIKERKYPNMPITYEKFQVYDLAKEMDADWIIFFDSDTLIHPDLFDMTELLTPDTVLYNDKDFAGNRWKYDKYFQRDGRNIGACGWFSVCSKLTLDLWKPIEDLSLDEILSNIFVTNGEKAFGMTAEHLIDDYVCSRNIAKYGLKHKTMIDIKREIGRDNDVYFWHEYLITKEEKVIEMKKIINEVWKLK